MVQPVMAADNHTADTTASTTGSHDEVARAFSMQSNMCIQHRKLSTAELLNSTARFALPALLCAQA